MVFLWFLALSVHDPGTCHKERASPTTSSVPTWAMQASTPRALYLGGSRWHPKDTTDDVIWWLGFVLYSYTWYIYIMYRYNYIYNYIYTHISLSLYMYVSIRICVYIYIICILYVYMYTHTHLLCFFPFLISCSFLWWSQLTPPSNEFGDDFWGQESAIAPMVPWQ